MPKPLPDPDEIWTDDDARDVLAAWRRTKVPLGTFARENGFVATRLYWWRKRLSKDAAPIDLVPAAIIAAPESEVSAVVRVASNVTIEIAKASPRVLAEIIGELARTNS